LNEEIADLSINMNRLVLTPLLILAVSMSAPLAHTQESASAKKPSEPSYVVVLKNGQQIPSRTKPISGFGKVRYMEPGGTNRVLPISAVDIDKTRAANAGPVKETTGGTLSVGGELAGSETTKLSAGQKTGGAEKARNQSVRVYSATWCPYCRQLKQFLAENGISASITEVDKLPKAQQERAQAEMKRLTGKVSYPTVVIGNQAVAGFSPSWILKSLGR
jgi:glutaredoxin 3